MNARPSASERAREWLDSYTGDFSREDLQRLFTHDTRDAYNFFTRGLDEDQFVGLPWWKALALRGRHVFVAFVRRLPPARRALYLGSLVLALVGVIELFRNFSAVDVPLGVPLFQIGLFLPTWAEGTFALIAAFLMVNLLVLLEVADRLSLKGELEVAREIQLAMLPRGTLVERDIEVFGTTRPANTVGGDFYDVLPQRDGTVILALGDVAGKGSPAALLMALLLAVLRTLVDERLPASALIHRLNAQICRHTPASRFITLFYAVYEPGSGRLTYVNAGQNPPLIRRCDGRYERLTATGVALGMFDGSRFESAATTVAPGELLVIYSDGVTEAENAAGHPFEEDGLCRVIDTARAEAPAEIGAAVLRAVERHAGQPRFADDLTVLLLKRAA